MNIINIYSVSMFIKLIIGKKIILFHSISQNYTKSEFLQLYLLPMYN